MPFQSEKQRRFLHANHPEIAKRWEKEYATGGISNHFRKKFFTGALADTQQGQAMSPGTSASGGLRHTPSGNGGGGGPKPHLGPTFAEIEAQKKAAAAAAAAEKKAIADAQYKEWITRKDKKKKKVKHFKKLNPVKINSKFTEDTKQTNGESKTFIKNKFSIEDLITGNINRHTDLVTPNLGTISTFMHPEGIQVQTGGDMGPIEHFPLSGPQSWAVNPGKPQDDDFSDIEGQEAKLGKLPLIQMRTLEKKVKAPDIYGKPTEKEIRMYEKLLEMDKEEKVYKMPILTAAKGGVARKNYFHGGILDINESEEIISDDGNDIELTDYNAAFDEPTGVKSLFQAKDGGRIGLRRGTSGAPGGGDPGMTSGGGNQGHGGGADRMPVSTPKSTYTGPTHSPHTDTPAQIEEQRVIDRNKLALIGSEDDELVGWHPDADDKANQFRTETVIKVLRRKDLTKDEKRRQLKYQYEELKKGKKLLSDIQKGAAVHPIVGLLVGIFQGNKLKKEQDAEIAKLEGQMGSLEDWDLKTRHHAVDTPYQILEQRVLDLTQPRTRDDTGGPDGPPSILNPVTLEVGEEYAQGDYDFDSMSNWNAMKQKQALNAALQEKWAAEKEAHEQLYMVANSGGLANLFRVKNQ